MMNHTQNREYTVKMYIKELKINIKKKIKISLFPAQKLQGFNT